MSALAFCGMPRNGLDDRTALEIRSVDLIAEERGSPYARFAVLLSALHRSHQYHGGASRPFIFHVPLYERQLKWGEQWPC